MAGPIKISIVADAGKAIKEVTAFSDTVEENTHRVVTGLGDSKLTGGFGKMQEGFDVLDTRAMGFRDTITGVQDSMTGFQAIMGQGEHASDTFGDKLLLLGTGVGDLASGMANFIIPMMAIVKGLRVWTGAQAALNIVMAANPVVLIVLAIIALIAVIVLAYKKSDTFRAIVDAAFKAVWSTIQAVFGWVKSHWQLLFGILTGPVGLAVKWIVQHWSQIVTAARSAIDRIRGFFSGLGGMLKGAGRALIQGFIDGIKSMFGPVSSALGWITDHLPSWKGPPSRDARLLRGVGRLTIAGFIDGMRSRFGDARSELAAFTAGLGGAAGTGEIRVGSPTAPAWADRLAKLLDGGIVIRLESSGQLGDDALLELIADRVSARGGKASTLGIRT